MHVGFHLRYQRCESTWVGLQIANWLKSFGISSSVLSFGARSDSVLTEWDKKVTTDYKLPFMTWLANKTHVVWAGDVTLEDIEIANLKKVKTILIASWNDPAEYMSLYSSAHKVVCLSPSLSKRLTRIHQLKNVHYAPLDIPSWSVSSSLTLRPDRPKVLINLRGPRKQQLGTKLYDTLTRWFKKVPAEWLLWVPKSLNHRKSWIHKCISSKHEKSSISLINEADWNSQRLILSKADLHVLPVTNTNHGLSAIMSLFMGTPVVTFDLPPANEYLNKANSALVPCQIQYLSDGIAQIVPDLLRLDIAVQKLATQPELLGSLKKHTADDTSDRKQLFKNAWQEVFDL